MTILVLRFSIIFGIQSVSFVLLFSLGGTDPRQIVFAALDLAMDATAGTLFDPAARYVARLLPVVYSFSISCRSSIRFPPSF